MEVYDYVIINAFSTCATKPEHIIEHIGAIDVCCKLHRHIAVQVSNLKDSKQLTS